MRFMLGLTAAVLFVSALPVQAAPVDDAVSSVTHWLDKFNAGDMDAFYAAHASNPVIIDEFAPFVWVGKDAPHVWADGFEADAKARHITDPRMDYAAPIRAESDGKSAYIVLPTIYRIKRDGRSMSAAGAMTFVMSNTAGGWKIASWTYAAPEPAPDR